MPIKPTNAITMAHMFSHMAIVSRYVIASLLNDEAVQASDEFFASAVEWAESEGDKILNDADSIDTFDAVSTVYVATLQKAAEHDLPVPDDGPVREAIDAVIIIANNIKA